MCFRPDVFLRSFDDIIWKLLTMIRMVGTAVVCLMFSGIFCAPDWTCAADCPDGDLSGDCVVDIEDLSLFTTQWLEGVTIPNRAMREMWARSLFVPASSSPSSMSDQAICLPKTQPRTDAAIH